MTGVVPLMRVDREVGGGCGGVQEVAREGSVRAGVDARSDAGKRATERVTVAGA